MSKSLSQRREPANENKDDQIPAWSGKAFKGTVVNRALPPLLGGSLEITLTIPLIHQQRFFPCPVCPNKHGN